MERLSETTIPDGAARPERRRPAGRPAAALALQRSAGNHAVARAVAGGGRPLRRVVWAVDDDHVSAVKLLAKASKAFWRDEEPSGLIGTCSLDTDASDSITLWGHTNNNGARFGADTPTDLVVKLLKLGLDESRHTRINLVSCALNATASRYVQTYAQDLQDALNEAEAQTKRHITVYTHRMAPEKHDSILYRNEELQRAAYIVFPAGEFYRVEYAYKTTQSSSSSGSTTAKDWQNFVKKLKQFGYTVEEMPFSGLLGSLVRVVRPKQHHKYGDKSETGQSLLTNVHGN